MTIIDHCLHPLLDSAFSVTMAPAKKKARKGKFDLFRSTLQEYHDGRQSVQEIVKLCRAYQGPNCHLLWDGRGKRVSTKHLNKCYIDACFSLLSEEKMIDLIRAMIAEDPGFCSIVPPPYTLGARRTFLSVALECADRTGKPTGFLTRTAGTPPSTCFDCWLCGK